MATSSPSPTSATLKSSLIRLIKRSFNNWQLGLTRAIALSLLLFPFLDKDEVRYRVPGIVNANKEEQQRSSADEKQGRARMRVSCECRSGQHCVCRAGQQHMKQPVLEYGPVDSLHSH